MIIFKEVPENIIKPLEDSFYNYESYKAVIPQFLILPNRQTTE